MMNMVIAKATGSNEATAFINGSQVKRRLTVPVTDTLFVLLTMLCHRIGVERFSNSMALKMVNAGSCKADIKIMLKRTLSNVN